MVNVSTETLLAEREWRDNKVKDLNKCQSRVLDTVKCSFISKSEIKTSKSKQKLKDMFITWPILQMVFKDMLHA